MIKRIILLIVLFTLAVAAFAQENIKGAKVVTTDNTPLLIHRALIVGISDYNNIDEKKLIELYNNDKMMEKYLTTLAVTSIYNRPKSILNILKTLPKGSKVLDYGCGVGTHGIVAAQRGCISYNYDISNIFIDFLKWRLNKRGLSAIACTSLEGIPKNIFNCVVCTDLIEHVVNPIGVLKEIVNHLVVGGVLLLEVSYSINLNKGHLPVAINTWKTKGIKVLNKYFKEKNKNVYILKRK
jgi:2-polyprenyl-3-methyl-5-hydroxy-6-metoxy-1,4-benzoquinol methylase